MYIRHVITTIALAWLSTIYLAADHDLTQTQEEKNMPFENDQLIDLSHPLNSHVPTWDGSCGFHLKIKCDYTDCEAETKFRIHRLDINAGIGTHMDSPRHCFSEGKSIDQLDLHQLIVPAAVIDISKKADAHYLLSAEDIIHFENQYGKIPPYHLVIVYTGWSRYWHDIARYRNLDDQGMMRFPTISGEAAQYLIERQIVGIGIDTLSPDLPSTDYPVHRLILGLDKYLIENVANAHQLPPYGAYVIALPLKIEQGTESPVRMIGWIPSK